MKPSYLLTVLIIILPILVFFHFRGILAHDEGYVLNSAEKFLTGQIPYKDFHFSYTPMSIFLTAFSYVLFGKSIFASRILMLFISVVSSIFLFRSAQLITRRQVYGFIAVFLYVAWGPTHINFSWPVMFVILFLFLSMYFALLSQSKFSRSYAFLSGFFLFCVFLSKQNFGIATLTVFLAFLSGSMALKKIFYAVSGYMWGIIAFCIYLLFTDSFAGFINDFYTFTIRKILINQELTTPIVFVDTPLQTIARACIYLIFPFLSILAISILIVRKKYFLLFIPITTLAFFLVGIRPTSDYIHLVPLLSLVGLPLVILMNKYPLTGTKLFGYGLFIVLVVAGIHSALYKGYYRWDIPLYENTYFLKDKALVFTNYKFHREYFQLKKVINTYTQKNDYIYFDSYSPIFYFLFERRQIVPYDFPGFIQSESYQRLVVYNLILKKVNVVFLASRNGQSPIEKFVQTKYHYKGQIGDNYVFTKY